MFGCERSPNPPKSIVKEALELKFQLTSNSLKESFGFNDVIGKVRDFKVKETKPIVFGDESILSITGMIDWQLSDNTKKVVSPFTLFFVQGNQGQSWRLVQPSRSNEDGEIDLLSYPLDIQ